jgi:hypothetical protein
MGLFPVILSYTLAFFFCLRRGLDRRGSFLAATVICGTAVVVLTEFLSLLHRLDPTALSIGWWLVVVGLSRLVLVSPKVRSHHTKRFSISLTAKIFLAGLVLIFTVLAILAVGFAPNTWDAMTYHLARVEHWAQNKSIAYYPTHILRQATYPPWAEWALLQLRILSGGDHFYGLLQWLAMVVSTVGVSLIARWLGAGMTGQCLAGLLSACLPMGILQAASTQNDYVLTMWLVVFVYFLLNFIRGAKNPSLLLASLSLGLAFLTKGYAYLYCAPFLVLYLLTGPSKSWLHRMKMLLVLIGIALMINAGYFYRNEQAFGHLIWAQEQLVAASLSVNVWLANILRNTALHLGTIYAPYNEWLTGRLQDFAYLLHIDLNPTQGSWSTEKFVVPGFIFNEDYAGNLASVLLFIFTLICAGIKFGQGRGGLQWTYAGAVGSMFLLLCLVMRFQVFNSRFHLAVFVLGAAWTAFVLEKIFSSKWLLGLGLLVLVFAVPWFLYNETRPLFLVLRTPAHMRIAEYFRKDPSWIQPMAGLSGPLNALGCGDIGLITGEDSKEYLLWATMRWFKLSLSRIEHVDVSNQSRHLDYPLGTFNPCAIVLLNAKRDPTLVLPSGIYNRVWGMEDQEGNIPYSLYRKIQ